MSDKHFKFKCPYCFADIEDHKVHFRSVRVNEGDFPGFQGVYYKDWQEYENAYTTRFDEMHEGEDEDYDEYEQAKQAALDHLREMERKYQKWDFFIPRNDDKYEAFWARYSSVYTEDPPKDDKQASTVEGRRRRVLDPSDPDHRIYLKPRTTSGKEASNPNASPLSKEDSKEDEEYQAYRDYLLRDEEGMVYAVELKEPATQGRTICDQRVCPECHNPLPVDYGKFHVKFIALIGGRTSGKTVYISKLLSDITQYVSKSGMEARVRSAGTLTFLNAYRVVMGEALPDSTQPDVLPQPLVYDINYRVGDYIRSNTIVLYDISGEVYQTSEKVKDFAPFVQHADGIMILLDPKQFPIFAELRGPEQEEIALSPDRLMDTINRLVSTENKSLNQSKSISVSAGPDEDSGVKIDRRPQCHTPVAVCLAKSDEECVRDGMNDTLYQYLTREVEGVKNPDGYYARTFNAEKYNPLSDGLRTFFQENMPSLDTALHISYSKYAYFAFTALGCGAETRMDEREGKKKSYALGPTINPLRIEEPLLWLFYEFGYIGTNAGIHYPGKIRCPHCGWYTTEPAKPEPAPKLPWWKRLIRWFRRVVLKKPDPSVYNMRCKHCKKTFFVNRSDDEPDFVSR